MIIRKAFTVVASTAFVLGLGACGGGKLNQNGPLSFGAPDGDIENTLCGVFDQRNAVADVAANISDGSLWITDVEAVEAKHWESVRSSLSVIDSGDSSLMGWNTADLDNEEVRREVDKLVALDAPYEVRPGQSVQIALEGLVAANADDAEVSQLRISYKTEPNAAKESTVLGNIRYSLKADTCES